MKKPVILIVFIMVSMAATAQIEGEIRGTVTDRSGTGVSGVRVDILSRAGAAEGRYVHSDIDGRYALTGVRPGFYSIQFSGRGYGTIVINGVPVSRDETTAIEVILTPASGKEIEVVQYVKPLLSFQKVVIE